jgi:archaellum biogenesis ATPase FlaH
MKDNSNYFNTPKGLKKERDTELWQACCSQVRAFAGELENAVTNKETPYVLALEGGWGTGKTYFASRFCWHLQQKGFDALYFSVWEKDYLADPFIAFADEIAAHIGKNDKAKELLDALKKSVSLSIGPFTLSVEKLAESLGQSRDNIRNLKESMEAYIQDSTHKKLILIVDELDRCRPDYAVKTLEVIKHFFDIKGLFIILPVNRTELQRHIDGFYNLHSLQAIPQGMGEAYLRKFINDFWPIPPLSYKEICEGELTADKFPDNPRINTMAAEDPISFNSLYELQKWFIIYAGRAGLSYRELLEALGQARHFINYDCTELVRCRLLAHRLCVKFMAGKGATRAIIHKNDDEWCYSDISSSFDDRDKVNIFKISRAKEELLDTDKLLSHRGEIFKKGFNLHWDISGEGLEPKGLVTIETLNDYLLELQKCLNNKFKMQEIITKELIKQKGYYDKNVSDEEITNAYMTELQSRLDKHQETLNRFITTHGSDNGDEERWRRYDQLLKFNL